MNTYQITVLPYDRILNADEGENLLHVLQQNSLAPDAPCGGNGKCGKCIVYINDRETLACQTVIRDNITVRIPEKSDMQILKHGTSVSVQPDGRDRYILAYDIGSTTVVCYLLDGISGEELAKESILNPQTAYGADVISRIEYVLKNHSSELQYCITHVLASLAAKAAAKAGIPLSEITLTCVVGNTAMHHLFLGIDPSPLTVPPYMPKVSNAMEIPAAPLLPIHPEGRIRILPNIAGFVGADTVACMTSVHFDQLDELTLMIDIGTNGEMVLGDRALEKLSRCHVAVFGLGGVGSYAAEILARSGVGELTLVDQDTLSLTNINRQMYALSSTVGEYKAEAAARRCRDINPDIRVHPLCATYDAAHREDFFAGKFDYIADCIDLVTCKLDLIQQAGERGIPIISALGTGNKLDPSLLQITDISRTSVCPLARVMRRELRDRGIRHLQVVYSPEPAAETRQLEAPSPGRRSVPASVPWVPSTAGILMASAIVRNLIANESE